MNSFKYEEIAARFHVEIETIHSFANGNGRFRRILTNQICKYHSFKIPTWGHTLASNPKLRRDKYIDAITLARRKRDFSDMVAIMFA